MRRIRKQALEALPAAQPQYRIQERFQFSALFRRNTKVFVPEYPIGVSNFGVAPTVTAGFKQLFYVLRGRSNVIHRFGLAAWRIAIVARNLLNFIPIGQKPSLKIVLRRLACEPAKKFFRRASPCNPDSYANRSKKCNRKKYTA
jgi:hypothetical protein